MPGTIPGRGGRRNGQRGGEILPAHVYLKVEKIKAWITPGFSSFLVGGPSSSAKSGGDIFGMRCMVPQSFVTKGNRLYLEF
jgi:hypothetical protein